MRAMAFQITDNPTGQQLGGTNKDQHTRTLRYWSFVRLIHRSPVDSLHRALPLAKILATCRNSVSNTGPCTAARTSISRRHHEPCWYTGIRSSVWLNIDINRHVSMKNLNEKYSRQYFHMSPMHQLRVSLYVIAPFHFFLLWWYILFEF